MNRIPLKGGEEYDYLTGWRRFICRHSGDAKRAKRSYNRRMRRLPIEVDW